MSNWGSDNLQRTPPPAETLPYPCLPRTVISINENSAGCGAVFGFVILSRSEESVLMSGEILHYVQNDGKWESVTTRLWKR